MLGLVHSIRGRTKESKGKKRRYVIDGFTMALVVNYFYKSFGLIASEGEKIDGATAWRFLYAVRTRRRMIIHFFSSLYLVLCGFFFLLSQQIVLKNYR